MKNESPAKKHHFWILFGLVPLFTLIGVIVVDAKVGSRIEDRKKEIDDASKSVSGKTPKPVKLIEALDKVALLVEKKQGSLHKENWDRQKDLFTWPRNSEVFKKLEERRLPFGSDLPDLGNIFSEFQRADTYQAEYSSATLERDGTVTKGNGMADLMAPTQFRGGWQSVLRYVNDFGTLRISKDQVWLVLEDMWVQRSLLSGLRSVNTDLARFEQVPATDPAPAAKGQTKTKKLFRNRTWELALEIVTDETTRRQRLTGTLTNISERLQLLGKSLDGGGNGMALNVWLSADRNAQPMVFKIGGEYLPGRGAMQSIRDKDGNPQVVPANVLAILPHDDHYLPPGINSTSLEIARVEQVYDVRTVPLKRIDALVIGHPAAMDARSVAAQANGLVAPLSKTNGGLFTEAYVTDPLAADPNAPGGAMPGGAMPGGSLPGGSPDVGPTPGGGRGGPGGFGGPGGMGAAAARPVGGGPLVAVIDGNKKRYLAVTSQVRRMPVGMVVVVDQAYSQDVLLALSNSPLRFQITQVTWTRFRGTLEGLGITPGGSAGENTPDYNRSEGSFGRGFGPGDPGAGGGALKPGGLMSGFGAGQPGVVGPTPGSGFPPGVGSFPPGGFPPGAGSFPSGPRGGANFPGAGSGSSVVSESQITSGLVELSVYGVVSLYEAPKAAEAPAANAGNTTPAPTTPAPTTPTEPMPMVPNNQTAPKKRRRTRA